MQILFVITGLTFLVATIAQVVSDMFRMVDNMQFNFEVFETSIVKFTPSAHAWVYDFLLNNLAQTVAVKPILFVLAQPTFAVLGVTGFIFILLSFLFRKRKNNKDNREFI